MSATAWMWAVIAAALAAAVAGERVEENWPGQRFDPAKALIVFAFVIGACRLTYAS